MTIKLFSVQRIEELRLSQSDETVISALIQASFSIAYDGRSFFQNRPHCRFLARDDDIVIGHLAVVYRAIRLGDLLVDIIGIADVAVDEDHRRKGVGARLVEAALEEGKAANADFALLFGEEGIYEKAGFRPVSNRITLQEMEGARTSATVRENNPWLKVKQLSDVQWDDKVPVDLAGFSF